MRSLTLVTVLPRRLVARADRRVAADGGQCRARRFGRAIGRAILVLCSSPAGLRRLRLMIAGAVMLHHTPHAARIVATIGTVVVLVAGLGVAAMLARSYANCGGAGCGEELVRAVAAFAYALAQIGLIALIWRVRATMPPAG
ncbi:MAG: hypothetical protein U1F37_14720 [Alphaproteobacteria bacterium]